MPSAARWADRWSDASLEAFRARGDALADDFMDRARGTGSSRRFNEVLAACPRNADAVPTGAPPELRTYLADSGRIPSWADLQAIERAQEFFTRHGPWIMVALHCASLPYAYGAKHGVQVVARTARLQDAPWKRLLATAQLVVDVMAKGGFAPGGFAIRSLQRVRLIHAAVRAGIRRDETWPAARGLPINQEDMAGTVLSFSQVVIEALQAMDIAIGDDDADAFVHAWDVAGALLGVDPVLRMTNRRDASRLARKIERRQWGSTAEGRALTRSLCAYLEELFGTQRLPARLVGHFLGERRARDLGLDEPAGGRLLIGALRLGARLTSRAAERSSAFAHAPEVLGRRLLAALCRPVYGDERAALTIPGALAADAALSRPNG